MDPLFELAYLKLASLHHEPRRLVMTVSARPLVNVERRPGETMEEFALNCSDVGARFGGWTLHDGIPPRDMHPLPTVDDPHWDE